MEHADDDGLERHDRHEISSVIYGQFVEPETPGNAVGSYAPREWENAALGANRLMIAALDRFYLLSKPADQRVDAHRRVRRQAMRHVDQLLTRQYRLDFAPSVQQIEFAPVMATFMPRRDDLRARTSTRQPEKDTLALQPARRRRSGFQFVHYGADAASSSRELKA
jgi:hypothetical protein